MATKSNPSCSFSCFPSKNTDFLSLRHGSLFSGSIAVCYSFLNLGHCMSLLETLPKFLTTADLNSLTLYGIVIVATISHAVTLLVSAVMIVGAVKEKKCLIRPWLVWMTFLVTVLVILFILWTSANMVYHYDNYSPLYYACEFLGLLMRFYMLMFVGNYYKQLEEFEQGYEKITKFIDRTCHVA